MLRARTDREKVSRWEKFVIDFVPNVSGYYSIKSGARADVTDGYFDLNKGVIRAELNYPGGDDGMLRAMGSPNDGYQTAEQYQFTAVAGGYWTIKNRSTGKYLKAESGYSGQRDGMIRAAGDDPASYTTHFRIETF